MGNIVRTRTAGRPCSSHLAGVLYEAMAVKRAPLRRKKKARRTAGMRKSQDLQRPAQSILAAIMRLRASLAEETDRVERRRIRRILNRVYLMVRGYREVLELVAQQSSTRAQSGIAEQIQIFMMLEAEFRMPLRERSN
jgi:hypothetical protein